MLAQIVQVQAQTMVKTVNRLDARGHITRRRDSEDRRAQLVSLTDDGTQALARAADAEQQLLAQLSIDNSMFRQQLKVVLHQLAKRQAATARR
jgi:DNA-binding MarR family transcriptional regulator